MTGSRFEDGGLRLAVLVQSHPKRAHMARPLAEEIGGTIVLDPDPNAALPSPWGTYRACLAAIPPDASHALIIQDDATPCPINFLPAVRAAISARPDRIVTLFVAGGPVLAVREIVRSVGRDHPWARIEKCASSWIPAIALVWPVEQARELEAWADAAGLTRRDRADDEIIGRFVHETRRAVLATVPSLVEHRDRVPSLIGQKRSRGGGDPGRVAACYVEDCDPLTIDWTLGPD